MRINFLCPPGYPSLVARVIRMRFYAKIVTKGSVRTMSLFRRKKRPRVPFCTAVVPAAGFSSRMGGEDKILLRLGDHPVLARTLLALEVCPLIHEIVVVTREDMIVPVGDLCKDYVLEKVTRVVTGGASRTQSVLSGICEADPQAELIAIHDGARPFVTQEVLENVLSKAAECGAAAPAIPLTDTVKRAKDGVVEETLNREVLFAVQTPQVFEASLIKAAIKKAMEEGVSLTDDCAAVERLGMKVVLTAGDRTNLKLTTPADLDLGMGILNGRGEFV